MATMMYQRMVDRSQAEPRPHVVLVSRRLGFREQLGAVLERQGWCVRYADSVTAAAREFALAPADVLMLDGWAAITGSVSALERLLVSQPGLAVVVSSPISLEDRRAQHLRLSQARRALRRHNEELEGMVAERTKEVRHQAEELVRRKQELIAAKDATITAFCSLAEARDNETGNHIRRTQHYVKSLAERLRDHPHFARELDEETIQLMFKSAPLHDIGKVGIPDAILNKPGKLTPEEWTIMKRHCEFGRDSIAMAEKGCSRISYGRQAC